MSWNTEIGTEPISWQVADLIDNQQARGTSNNFRLSSRPRDRGRCRSEEHTVARLDRLQSHSQMCPADPGRPENHRVLAVLENSDSCQALRSAFCRAGAGSQNQGLSESRSRSAA